MILIDLSSALHKSVHGLTSKLLKNAKSDYIDLKEFRPEFYLTVLNILCDHISKFREYSEEIVICLDDRSGLGNWRRKIFPMYKHARKSFRDSFKTFDYNDAHILFDEFQQALESSQSPTLFKTIGVPECEADDVILVLARYFAEQGRNVLILSPDKDFMQLQDNPRIKQYSWMTNKMIEMPLSARDDWLLEHICIGDVADNVPRVVDFKSFNPGVEEFLKESGLLGENEDAWDFSNSFFNYNDFDSFGGVFTREKFGKSTLKRLITQTGSLEAFLDLHPVHRKNYFRNRQLVLEEGIPNYLRDRIISKINSIEFIDTPAKTLVDKLKLQGFNLPDLLSNKYITETQLGDFLDW